tara:strand:+ start:2071 stop:2793 length:723 start_codon:yes stop_codon:yes gene_type:complete
MPIINKGTSFSNGEQLTADKINDLVDLATFNQNATDSNTTTISTAGQLVVNSGGISSAQLATDAVETAKIKDANVTFAKLTDVIDDDTMATATDTTLATSESIKAYVTAMRPKFVPLTGGTTGLIKDFGSSTTVTYNIADFTADMNTYPEFATSKITGLLVEGYAYSKNNTNLLTAEGAVGSTTVIARSYASSSVYITDSATTLMPINSDTSTFEFEYTVGDTTGNVQSAIRGAIIQPGL